MGKYVPKENPEGERLTLIVETGHATVASKSLKLSIGEDEHITAIDQWKY